MLEVSEHGRAGRPCLGDLSINGASFVTTSPPEGELVRLTFTLPTYAGLISAAGYVVSRAGAPQGTQVGVAFTDIDVEAQLAIAQWLDDEPLFASAI